jgi:hypothetical protein
METLTSRNYHMKLSLLILLASSTGTIIAAQAIPIPEPAAGYVEWTALGTLCTALILLIAKTIPQMLLEFRRISKEHDQALHEIAKAVEGLSTNCATRAEQYRKDHQQQI